MEAESIRSVKNTSPGKSGGVQCEPIGTIDCHLGGSSLATLVNLICNEMDSAFQKSISVTLGYCSHSLASVLAHILTLLVNSK